MTYAVSHRRRASLGCACVPGMGALGQVTTPGVAGPVNGIADLEHDLRTLVQRAVATFGSQVTFSKPAFDALRDKITSQGQHIEQLTKAELQQFVAGTIAQVAGAVVRAKQLSTLTVSSSAAREQNQAAQAALIQPARMMYDTASEVLRNITPVPPSGTSGLGIAPLIIIAIAVVAVALGAAAIVAITYWVDSSKRLEYASQQAEAICRAATPPCSAAQRAQIQRDLALGPYDAAAATFTGTISAGISDTIKYAALAIGGVALVGTGWMLWKHRKMTRNPRGRPSPKDFWTAVFTDFHGKKKEVDTGLGSYETIRRWAVKYGRRNDLKFVELRSQTAKSRRTS